MRAIYTTVTTRPPVGNTWFGDVLQSRMGMVLSCLLLCLDLWGRVQVGYRTRMGV